MTDGQRSGTHDTRRFGSLTRIAIVFVAVTLSWVLIVYGNEVLFGTAYTRTGHIVNAVLATAVAVPTVVLARRFLDNRPLDGLGLSSARTGWRSFLIGMGCYLIPAGLALTGALVVGWGEISLETSLFTLVQILLGLLLLVFFYEAFPEEFVFRGYIYRNLASDVSRRTAVVGQAVLFGLWGAALWVIVAGIPDAVGRLVLFVFIALVIGAIRVISGDVWACIGFHLAFQTVQQLFGETWAAGVFAVTASASLEMIVFGLIPVAAAVSVLRFFVREDVDWDARSGSGTGRGLPIIDLTPSTCGRFRR